MNAAMRIAVVRAVSVALLMLAIGPAAGAAAKCADYDFECGSMGLGGGTPQSADYRFVLAVKSDSSTGVAAAGTDYVCPPVRRYRVHRPAF